MADEKYFDLLVTDNDLTLDVGGNPERCWDRNSIAQDLAHMIRETGLLVELVANRDTRKKAANIVALTIAVENDERIVPGTCEITEPSLGKFYIVADTYEFGSIAVEVDS